MEDIPNNSRLVQLLRFRILLVNHCLCLTAAYVIFWILEDFYTVGGSWFSDSIAHLLMGFIPVVNTVLVVFGIWYILIWPYKTIKNHFTKESPNG